MVTCNCHATIKMLDRPCTFCLVKMEEKRKEDEAMQRKMFDVTKFSMEPATDTEPAETQFDRNISALTSQLAEVLAAKNSDYGDSHAETVQDLGEDAILFRLRDKYNRLKNLIRGGKQAVAGESIEDTLMDLAGYALLELERRKR